MMIRHPNPAAIREAVDKIRQTVEASEGESELEMSATVIRRNECGTVACVCGWYVLAWLQDKGITYGWADYEYYPDHKALCHTGGASDGAIVGWEAGASLLGQALGFPTVRGIETWAAAHPELWGNLNGKLMFDDDAAYVPEGEDATIEEVMNHWLGVADRIEAHG